MNSPAFQFYAQDFLTGVMFLTNEEIGIYIKMLAKQWTDGQIPKKRLGFLVGIEWDNFSDELKSKFTDLGGYILNERLENEREKKQKYLKKQSENGKKGGRPKKSKPLKNTENTNNKTQKKPKPLKNKNPNENQKKPLEDEIEIEEENNNEKEEQLKMPFSSKNFKAQWDLWKVFRKKKDKFSFLNVDSENRKLTELKNLSGNDEKTAIKIIQQSIDNGWKGLFELKINGKQTNNTGDGESRINRQTAGTIISNSEGW